VKYQWPDEGALKLETSPSTRTVRKWLASRRLASRFSWETLMGVFALLTD
jgi:hypothetical protein